MVVGTSPVITRLLAFRWTLTRTPCRWQDKIGQNILFVETLEVNEKYLEILREPVKK